MKTLLLIACLACPAPAQNAVQPPQNWTPATAYVHGCLEIVDLTAGSGVKLYWETYQGNYLGIPDPRLAASTTLFLSLTPGYTWDPGLGFTLTPYGLAYSISPALVLGVGGPGAWRVTDSGLEAEVQVQAPAAVHGCAYVLQALVLHHFGAPDVAYFTNPVQVWL